MNDSRKSLFESLTGWLTSLGVNLRAAFLLPIFDESIVADAERLIDPDFKRWVQNDPMVTGNSASRYGDDAPGYLTANGLGSLEIGATNDQKFDRS